MEDSEHLLIVSIGNVTHSMENQFSKLVSKPYQNTDLMEYRYKIHSSSGYPTEHCLQVLCETVTGM